MATINPSQTAVRQASSMLLVLVLIIPTGTTWLLKNSFSGGSSDIGLEFPDSAGDGEITTQSRPEQRPSRTAPGKPTAKPAPSRTAPGKPTAEPAPSSEEDEAAPKPAPSSEEGEAAPKPAPSSEEGEAAPKPAPSSEEDEAAPKPAPSSEEDEAAPEPAPSPELDDVQGELTRTSIGSPEPAGGLSFSEGVYELSGGGADIWGTSDSFEFAHQVLEGDGRVVVRVNSQTATHGWAKAGLMFRDDTSPGSPHVSLFQTPANGLALQYRSNVGGTSSHFAGPKATPPSWLRLERSGDRFLAYSSGDDMNWKLIGVVTVSLGAAALVGVAVTSHDDGTTSEGRFSDFGVTPGTSDDPSESSDPEVQPLEETEAVPADDGPRLLYSRDDIVRYHASMTRPGPYFATGDAGHGGPYSPNDGQRSTQLARDFLNDPQASYWIQPNLPFASGDPWPNDMVYVRPMHAAWIFMTQSAHPDREALRREVKALLLHHATHPSHDFSNATHYPVTFPGFAANPIYNHAAWMTRLVKARDMLGRDSFTRQENANLDQWFYDYSNWAFQWLHREQYEKAMPDRERRDYSQINRQANASRKSYDGGPLIGSLALAYTNRHAAVASAASLAANYLKFHRFEAPTSGGPSYGRWSVDRLLLHSQLFVEETIRFSVYPQGVQGDFERGDRSVHQNASAQQGWLYSANVLANLMEIAEYHAKRGDLSVWNYGTTQGFDGTAGRPVAGGFTEKNLHFYAWSMSRYVNNGWKRTNHGEPLALPHFYHDVIPAATASRFAPDDRLLRDAWRRSGSDFPPYPQRPQSQGMWDARFSESAKMIGLIEQAGATNLR